MSYIKYAFFIPKFCSVSKHSIRLLLEMATPGWGPRHPPGPQPRDGGWGRGNDYSKPRGTGDFLKNPPGVFGGFYVIKTAVSVEILL